MDQDRAKRVLWMAGLVTLGFLLRTTNAAEVFVGETVIFPGNDPYYQAHRVFQALAGYPWVPLVDPLLDHPYGAAPIWPPAFPWLLATLVRVLGISAAEPHAVETFLALSAPVTGALVCVPVYALARRILDGPGAWIAAALAVLVPAHLWYSRLGFVDHHAAVTLVQVCLFLGALVALQGGRSIGLIAALSFGMMLWNGFVLFVGILDLYLLAVFAFEDVAGRRRVARLVGWSHGAAALLILPLVVSTVRATDAPWGAFALSYLHPLVLAGVAGAAAMAAAAPRRGLAWVGALACVGLVAGIASGALGAVWGWVFARDEFMSSIQEVVPIFLRSDGALDLQGPTVWLTRFWFVVPVVLVCLARATRRGGRIDVGRLLLLVWATAFFGLALGQRRFAESAAPALAIVVAWGLREIQARVREAMRSGGLPPWVAQASAAALVAGLAIYGLGPYYAPILRDPGGLLAIAHASGRAPGARPVPETHRVLARLGEIAASEPRRQPRGVLNLWPLGHRVLYATGLPVVASPFGSHIGGDSFDDAGAFFLETDEEAALDVLDRRRSRYVVVDNDLGTIGAALLARGEPTASYYRKTQLGGGGKRIEYQPALYRTMYLRLALLAGTKGVGGTAPLRHFRLLVDAKRDHRAGYPKVFERVAGARLRFSGRPGTTYDLRYAFRSDAGRAREYEIRVVTDPDGRAEAVLPYSSERPELGQGASWQIRGPGVRHDLRVPEAAVVEGRTLDLDLS